MHAKSVSPETERTRLVVPAAAGHELLAPKAGASLPAVSCGGPVGGYTAAGSTSGLDSRDIMDNYGKQDMTEIIL